MLDRKSLFQKYPGAHLLWHAQKYIPEPASTLYQESRQDLEVLVVFIDLQDFFIPFSKKRPN